LVIVDIVLYGYVTYISALSAEFLR
jgi:hypothetical protein